MVLPSNRTSLSQNISSCLYSCQKKAWNTPSITPLCEIDFFKPLHLKHRKRSGGKSPYRHVPHNQRPPHLVARRNARERRRVQAVNKAFSKLRRYVPYEPKHKRLSKVKTLRIAIDYIHRLRSMIEDYDSRCQEQATCYHAPTLMDTSQMNNTIYHDISPECVNRTSANLPDTNYAYPLGWDCGASTEVRMT